MAKIPEGILGVLLGKIGRNKLERGFSGCS